MIELEFQYKPFIKFSVDHEYYTDRPGRDLKFIPLERTANLMNKLNIIMREDDDGMFLLGNNKKTNIFESFLKEKETLTFDFWITCRNPYFFHCTSLPLDVNNQLLLLKNTGESDDDSYLMHPGDAVSDAELYNSTQGSIEIPLDKSSKETIVTDVSGNEIGQFKYDELQKNTSLQKVLPEGFYNVKSNKAEKGYIVQNFRGIRYPLALLSFQIDKKLKEILLESIHKNDQLPHFNFKAIFQGRSVYWRYLIYSKYTPDTNNLFVKSEDKSIEFSGPVKTKLTNGMEVMRFQSDKPLKMKEFSPYNFQLNKKGSSTSATGKVLVKRLPVPSLDSLKPESGKAESKIYSEILVYI